MRGRKPLPTALKLLRGNPGKRPINRTEPRPEALGAEPPEELASDDAKREWRRTIAPAIPTGQITSADRAMAIAHCELWACWRSQLAEAARHAHIIAAGPSGYPTPNPARLMANRTFLLLVRVDAELGLTPSSRSRVATGKEAGRPPRASEDDRFFG